MIRGDTMVYQAGGMLLEKTQEVFQGKVNDVIVCRDIAGNGKQYYTVLVVHDREIAKIIMDLFHREDVQNRTRFITDFTWKDQYFMVFDYVRERALERFFSSEISGIHACEQMALNLVVECLACAVPYPVLYLILQQGQIHISKDRNIYLGFCIDLEELSMAVTEKDCATLCAKIVFGYLGQMQSPKITSYKLLEKKIWKGGYYRFTQLYKDLKMAAQPLKREGLWSKIRRFFARNQDKIFLTLLIVCVALGMLALIMILSQLFFSDVPFFRLFVNPFKQIGTQILLGQPLCRIYSPRRGCSR